MADDRGKEKQAEACGLVIGTTEQLVGLERVEPEE